MDTENISANRLNRSRFKTPVQKNFKSSVIMTPGTESLNRVREAKLQKTAEKIASAASWREKWALEKQDRLKNNELKVKKMKAERLKKSQMLAKQRTNNLKKRADIEARLKDLEIKNLTLKNKANADAARKAQEDMKARRRQSVMLNNTILQRAANKKAELKAEEEKAKIIATELKQKDNIAITEAKFGEEQKRRQSMAYRGVTARIQKERLLEKKIIEQEEVNSIFQWRAASSIDNKIHKDQEWLRKRESVAHRLQSWKEEKQIMTVIEESKKNEELDTLESRHTDWLAVKEVEKNQKEKERLSLEGRLQAWRHDKEQNEVEKQLSEEAKIIENELAEETRKDVENYKMKIHKSRRDSMAVRIDKASKDKDWERGQTTLLALAMEDERLTMEEDRKAVQDFESKETEKRKISMLNHQEHERQAEKVFNEEVELAKKIKDEEDRELAEADRIELEAFQADERRKARESIANRVIEAKKTHESELLQHCSLLASIHADFALRNDAAKDVENYKKQQSENRRKSVALRLDSWRQQRMNEEKLTQKKAIQDEEDRRMRAMDRADMEAAQLMLKDEACLKHMIARY